ncbi:hypothetical protein BKA70DRAFT_1218205 [Coprinopsis sp. MPI-PUGE-AT-0042]|nr:hypothetical protein BKA70DRAFT_1218205 [Coprinopsis sp. MPI-PUGE-AT-0042]
MHENIMQEQQKVMLKQEEDMANILKCPNQMQTQVEYHDKQLGETRKELDATQKELDENRKQLEQQQMAALEEYQKQLEEAMLAQRASDELITVLKQEVEEKTKEIEGLKQAIQKKDEEARRMENEHERQMEGMDKHANECIDQIIGETNKQVEEIRAKASQCIQESKLPQAAAAHHTDKAKAEAAHRVEEAESAVVHRVEEAEVAAQVQVGITLQSPKVLWDSYRTPKTIQLKVRSPIGLRPGPWGSIKYSRLAMTRGWRLMKKVAKEGTITLPTQLNDEDNMGEVGDKVGRSLTGICNLQSPVCTQSTPPTQYGIHPPSRTAIRNVFHQPERNQYTRQVRAVSTPPARIVPPPATFRHSSSGAGPQYILGQTPLESPTPSPKPQTQVFASPPPPPSTINNNPSSQSLDATHPQVLLSLSDMEAVLTGWGGSLRNPPPLPHQPKQHFHQRVARRGKNPERTALLGSIRVHMNRFLRITKDADILWSDAALEDKQMVEDFENESGDGPSLDPIRWNIALGEQFAEYMVHDAGIEELACEVEIMFEDQLGRLKALLKKMGQKDGETEEVWMQRIQQDNMNDSPRSRAHARRATLFERWCKITSEERDDEEQAAAWKEIDAAVYELGLCGTSSDKSEFENDNGDVKTECVKIVDRDEAKVNAAGHQKPRNPGKKQVQERFAGPSRRQAMPGLPVNYYNSDWYSQIGGEERRELRVKAAQPLPNLVPDLG